MALHETEAVPDPEMLVALRLPHVRPLGTESVRATIPVNPFEGVTVIVVVSVCPALTGVGVEAATLKSGCLTVKLTIAECISGPLVPITVSAYVPPILALHDTVAVPEPVKLPGLMVAHVNPGGVLSVRMTVPENPFCEATVIVEAADWPTLTEAGALADIVKSGAGGPRLRKLRMQPQPIGVLVHCRAPAVPAPGASVQLPAGHQIQFILCGVC